jgi:hypothetical protein
VAGAALVLMAACTGPEPAPLAPPPEVRPSTTTGSTAPSTTTPPSEIPVALGLEAWNQWWQQWETVAWPPGNDNQLAPTTAAAVEDAQRAFLADWSPSVPVSATPHPQVTSTTESSMTVADCVLMVPPPSGILSQVGVPVTGEIGYDGLNWEISDVDIDGEASCVPSGMVEPATTAWNVFWERFPEVWMEPDPAAAVIATISAGDAQAYFEEQTALSAEQGWRLLGTLGDLQPVVTDVAQTLDGLAVIVIDCGSPVDGFGTYDGTGGPPFTELEEGRVWLASGSVLVTPGGGYVVSDWAIEPSDIDRCLTTLTEAGVG